MVIPYHQFPEFKIAAIKLEKDNPEEYAVDNA